MILDVATQRLICDGKSVRLTQVQTGIIIAMARAYPRAAKEADIAAEIWITDDEPTDPAGNIRVQISNLRGRLQETGIPPTVYTERGIGYGLKTRVQVIETAATTRATISASILERIASLLETHPNKLMAASVLKLLPAVA